MRDIEASTPEQPIARPPLGLSGPHRQTILGSVVRGRLAARKRAAVRGLTAEPLLLDLDDDVRLQAYFTPAAKPRGDEALAVLLHGWEGDAHSSYMRCAAAVLAAAGCATVRLNFRDHGGTQALNRELFHSCRITEVVDAVASIRTRYSPDRFFLVGYSLGGNFALRVAASPAAAGMGLEKVIAICPVLHPPSTMRALEAGFWPYRHYYLRKWRRSLRAKEACFPNDYRFGDLGRFRTLTATTDFFVREHTEFADIESYLNGYSIVGSVLAELATPALIIAAADDPIIPSQDFAALSPNPMLHLNLMSWGGHCGFISDYRLNSCVDGMILEALGLDSGSV